MTDRGNWMQTYTGRQFCPMDPRPDEIDIRDIAHALSMQCRYAGHVKRFYSVAEHCVLLSHVVPPGMRLEALMHDAAEAYLVDVPRPVKTSLPRYAEAERRIETVIAAKFGLSYPWPEIVMQMDTRILTDERRQLMAEPLVSWSTDGEPLGVRCIGFAPMKAESDFLARFTELAG